MVELVRFLVSILMLYRAQWWKRKDLHILSGSVVEAAAIIIEFYLKSCLIYSNIGKSLALKSSRMVNIL
jgi:hypothetical protein